LGFKTHGEFVDWLKKEQLSMYFSKVIGRLITWLVGWLAGWFVLSFVHPFICFLVT
jgi:hypothetical protein